MTHLFIINPVAGRANASAELCEEIRGVFSNRPEDKFTVEFTERPGHASEIAKRHAETGEPIRIYACGGDGTLFETLNGMYEYKNAAIGSYACGSGNDFAKLFSKRRPLVKELAEAPIHKADILKCGGEVALNVVSAGLDAAAAGMIARLKKLPFIHGKAAYLLAAAIKLVEKRAYRFKFEIDGEKKKEELLLFGAAMNGRYYGGGFYPTPEAVLDDGKIDLIRVKNMSHAKILPLVGQYKKGTHLKNEDVISVTRCTKVKIFSEKPVLITIDGEMRTLQNPEIEVLPSAVSVIMPFSESGEKNLLINC